MNIKIFFYFMLALIIFGTLQTNAIAGQLPVKPIKSESRDKFLVQKRGGSLGVVLNFGEGNEKVGAQKASKVSRLKSNTCYEIPKKARPNGLIWFILNNADRIGIYQNVEVKLKIKATHFSLEDANQNGEREVTRYHEYLPPIHIKLNSDITQQPSEKRVVFYAGQEDFTKLEISTGNSNLDQIFGGTYYFYTNKEIAYEKLIPGCKKNSIFAFFKRS